MSRIAKIIILILLLLVVSLPIANSAGTVITPCSSWTETCLSGEPQLKEKP